MNANDLLMGGGTKSAAFPSIGTAVTGPIVREPKVQQQTDPKDGSFKTFSNGDPMMQLVVQIQTSERDPADPDDDGIRALYIKAKMLQAVREAVKKAGAKGLEVGGELTVIYVADGEKTNKAFNAPKLYTATYRPPTGEAANNLLMGAAPVSPAPAGQPVAQVPATAPAGAVPAGVDPAIWAQMSTEQKSKLLAALGSPQ
ncbi:hypothetical protein OG271_03845 [Micromonospora rifamycinica]|uniref:hypothetical protein n=1 Tax=Micromonospora rifamycinica TaxID=291594 RepID=UPI002E2DB076|nr:hypothetical protein [Micromonospora rifamycinica]